MPATRVTIADLDTAAAWLECNEGNGGEADACAKVAQLLRNMADKRDDAKDARQRRAELKAEIDL